MSIEDRIATIADEAFGPFTVQSVDENLNAIEAGIASDKRSLAVAIGALESAEAYLVERGIEYKGTVGRTILLQKIREALQLAIRTSNPAVLARSTIGGNKT